MSNRNFDASTIIKIRKAQNAASNHNRFQTLTNSSINQLAPNPQTEHYDADVVTEYAAGSQTYYLQGFPIMTSLRPAAFPAIAPGPAPEPGPTPTPPPGTSAAAIQNIITSNNTADVQSIITTYGPVASTLGLRSALKAVTDPAERARATAAVLAALNPTGATPVVSVTKSDDIKAIITTFNSVSTTNPPNPNKPLYVIIPVFTTISSPYTAEINLDTTYQGSTYANIITSGSAQLLFELPISVTGAIYQLTLTYRGSSITLQYDGTVMVDTNSTIYTANSVLQVGTLTIPLVGLGSVGTASINGPYNIPAANPYNIQTGNGIITFQYIPFMTMAPELLPYGASYPMYMTLYYTTTYESLPLFIGNELDLTSPLQIPTDRRIARITLLNGDIGMINSPYYNTPQTATIPSLQNNTVYYFMIVAVSPKSYYSPILTYTPLPSVQPPTITGITPTPVLFTVAFNQPPSVVGQEPIINYAYSLNGGAFVPFNPPQLSSPCIISNLTSSVGYSVALRAITVNHISESSNSVQATTLILTPPQPPIIENITANSTILTVTFAQMPATINTTPITNYLYSLNGGAFVPFNPPQVSSPCIISNLTPFVGYSVQLKSVTAYRESDPSNKISTATLAAVSPQPPTITSVVPGTEQLAVYFTAGTAGSDPTINYGYSLNNGSLIPFSPPQLTSPYTITGLTGGSSYTIYLKAITGTVVGNSTSTALFTRIPLIPPPTHLRVSYTGVDAGAGMGMGMGMGMGAGVGAGAGLPAAGGGIPLNQISVRFDPPIRTGAVSIAHYIVTVTDSNGTEYVSPLTTDLPNTYDPLTISLPDMSTATDVVVSVTAVDTNGYLSAPATVRQTLYTYLTPGTYTLSVLSYSYSSFVYYMIGGGGGGGGADDSRRSGGGGDGGQYVFGIYVHLLNISEDCTIVVGAGGAGGTRAGWTPTAATVGLSTSGTTARYGSAITTALGGAAGLRAGQTLEVGTGSSPRNNGGYYPNYDTKPANGGGQGFSGTVNGGGGGVYPSTPGGNGTSTQAGAGGGWSSEGTQIVIGGETFTYNGGGNGGGGHNGVFSGEGGQGGGGLGFPYSSLDGGHGSPGFAIILCFI